MRKKPISSRKNKRINPVNVATFREKDKKMAQETAREIAMEPYGDIRYKAKVVYDEYGDDESFGNKTYSVYVRKYKNGKEAKIVDKDWDNFMESLPCLYMKSDDDYPKDKDTRDRIKQSKMKPEDMDVYTQRY